MTDNEQLDLLAVSLEARGAGHRIPILDTPDIATARQHRDQALAQVEAHADTTWKADADRFLEEYLRAHPTMFVDDLWNAGLPAPREARALGPRFNAAQRRGWMVKSGSYRPSVRSNLTEKPVWRSLIYRGDR